MMIFLGDDPFFEVTAERGGLVVSSGIGAAVCIVLKDCEVEQNIFRSNSRLLRFYDWNGKTDLDYLI